MIPVYQPYDTRMCKTFQQPVDIRCFTGVQVVLQGFVPRRLVIIFEHLVHIIDGPHNRFSTAYTDLYHFLQIPVTPIQVVCSYHIAADKLVVNIPTKMAASSVERCCADGRSVVESTYRISRIVVKQTNSNCGTFNMSNTIEYHRNYFTRKLLHDNLSSDVALHFNVIKLVAAIFGGKLFGGSVLPASAAPESVTA